MSSRRRSSGRGWIAMAVALPGLVTTVAACTGGGGDDDAGRAGTPSSTTAAESTTSTTVVDYSAVTLAVVPGRTTTTTTRVGTMTVSGTVRGPDGPVAGATVRLQRFDTAGQVTTFEVGTDGAGRYQLRSVPGGRYRVRAWRAPDLAQSDATVGFLAATPDQRVDVVTERVAGLSVAAVTAPDPARKGAAVNLAVSVTERAVGADGVVRGRPVAGRAVSLGGLGAWVPADGSRDVRIDARTDGNGRVTFALRCVRAGPPNLTLRVDPPEGTDPAAPGSPATTSTRLAVSDCVDTAGTTTTAPGGVSTTTTTRP